MADKKLYTVAYLENAQAFEIPFRGKGLAFALAKRKAGPETAVTRYAPISQAEARANRDLRIGRSWWKAEKTWKFAA